ncbi:MAG: hypothetical protein IKJ56_11605 [Bacteroidales bacterium]|nr:hypothetical protein [Bacteroidales bacterium]
MRGLLKIFIFAIAMLLPCMVMGQDMKTQSQVQEYRVVESFIHGEPKLDSVPNLVNDGTGNVFVLGIIDFDSLVCVSPKGKDLFSICMENEMVKGMTARINKSRWNYNIFNPDCYYFFTSSSASVWYNILPYLPEKYFNLVLRTYPHRFEEDRLSDCFINDYVSANKTQIHSLKYRTYLCVLMKVTYFNITRIKGMRAYKKPTYLFHNSKFLEGLYIKVLIPLVDED